uniref:DNA topoisomerase n=1 Tax=Pararhodobacter marinus TaxID=2184063 RepID=UPI00351841A0
GKDYVPAAPRIYKNKAKNAQEAHECIRPTDMSADPNSLKLTDSDQRKLYDLIWKRTIACQMEAARLERTTVEIGSKDGQVGLRATGQVMLFDGFLKVYEEGRDDDEGEDGRLPQLGQGEGVSKKAVTPEQHFTQPPPRYTEATLVKRMEELGIGRPSTYASIVTTIQERGYVLKDKNRLKPEDKGRLVTIFLTSYFPRYLGYDFTAGMEEQLDDISAGSRDYKDVLQNFWADFSAALAETSDLRITEVLEKIDEVLAPHLYPPREDGSDPRVCPTCGEGRLNLKTARSGGAFIGCSNYPNCRYTRPLSGDEGDAELAGDGKLLGYDGEDAIRLKTGRFGPYVQRGEATEEVPKPPRSSLPKGWSVEDMDLDKALMLLSLPRLVGQHPEDGEPVEAAIGRFGPYVKHNKTYANLPEVDEVFTIGMNRAVELIAAKAARGPGRGAAAQPLKVLGDHPEGGAIQVMPGRYGPYVKWEKINATLPKEIEPEAVTMEQALELIQAKAATKGKKKAAPKKAPAKKAAPKKTAAKTTAKKTTAKKAPAKKKAEPEGDD